MGRVNDTISNANAAFRNLLLTVVVAGVGFGGYKFYDLYNAPQQKLAERDAELKKVSGDLTTERTKNAELTTQNAELNTQNTTLSTKNTELTTEVDRLQVAKKLLEVRHRLARLRVLEQKDVPALNPVTPSEGATNAGAQPNLATKIEFTEMNQKGEPIGAAKQFDIAGDMVYIDFLKVTFDDKFIEKSDLDRATSLALFQRIFGEHQEPVKGFQIDTVGTRPTAYARGTAMSEFEKTIWDDFWLIANDPKRAEEMGIRAANGDAIAIRVRPGKTYELDLRATGEMTFRVVEPPAPPAIVPSSP